MPIKGTYRNCFMKKGKFFVLPIFLILQFLLVIGSHTRTIPSHFHSVTTFYEQTDSFVVTGDLTALIQLLGRPWTYGVGAMGMITLTFLFLLAYALQEKKSHTIIAASLYGAVVLVLVIPWGIAYFFHLFLLPSYLAFDYLLSPNWFTPISIVINLICLLAIGISLIPEWRNRKRNEPTTNP